MRPIPRSLALLLAVGLLLAISSTPIAARHTGGCPDGGFDEIQMLDAGGALIWSAVTEYPSLVRSIDDGLQTVAGLQAAITAVDRNGNGVVCIKDIWEHNGGRGAPPEPEQAAGLGGFYYFVHGIDDRT